MNALHTRAVATHLHQPGFNINLLGGDKQPIHKWKSTPDSTTTRQPERDFARLPWNGYKRKNGEIVPPPTGAAVINGIGDARSLDTDKCTNRELVSAALAAMDLPDDYGWAWRSGSHKGYGALICCAEDIPESLASLFSGGILVGTPRDGADFKQLELRYSGCQTVLPPSLHPSGNSYEWLHGEPTEPPAVVTFEQLLAGFLAIAELPTLSAPVERPAAAARWRAC